MLGRIVRSQRGAFMVFFAILVPFFLGMIGFAVDAGFVYMQKAKMQDIADAAALAGAARLNDGSDARDGNVKSAVRAYADANGMKTTATNVLNLDQEGSMAPSKNNFQIAQGILSSVMDKDNVQRDHVRVVIAKRVPTFFIGILLPGEKEGVLVKAAAEAEYVAGEVPAVFDGARFMCGQYASENIYNKNTIVATKGLDFSIFTTGSGIKPDKLPEGAVGTVYQNDWNSTEFPEGWNSVRLNIPISADSSDKDKKEYEAGQKAIVKYQEMLVKKEQEGQAFDVNEFINAQGDKRYIGYVGEGTNRKFVNNIQDNDKKIDLYMAATDWENQWTREYQCYLTNHQIKNVKEIGNLIVTKMANIGTSGIIYGNIYAINGSNLKIGGESNTFKGTLYSGSNWDIPIGGIDNHFIIGNGVSIITAGVISIGKWEQLVERVENGILKSIDIVHRNESDNPNWHIYFGGSSSGSGSSGSSGSDTGTSAHVRLVK